MKRYVLFCTHVPPAGPLEWEGEWEGFETDERGAAITRAYQHEAGQCSVRVHDRHTGEDIEL